MHKLVSVAVWAGIVAAVAGSGCSSGQKVVKRSLVESTSAVSVTAFNTTIAVAAGRQENWVRNPIRVAQEFLQSEGAASVTITRQDNRAENPDSSTVTVIEDGYLDDSVRGTWSQFLMTRTPDGSWRIGTLKQAQRCHRGENKETYSSRPCP